MADAGNEALIKESGWEIWHDWNASMMRPITDWFCDAIGATPGQVALDVACGTGIPSLAVAERVAPNGKVVATDFSAAMLGSAGRVAKRLGVRNIEHREMDGMLLDFPDASFDAVTSKDGIIFCPDPVKAVAEMRRVLKPRGRFAVTAWAEPAKCHFFMTMFGPVSKALNRPPPDPQSPGPFRFAPPGEFERVLRAGGFADFEIEEREVFFEFDSLDQHWQSTSAMAAPVEAANSTLPPNELAALKRAVADALRPFMVGQRVRVPNVARCASGRR
jgi:SAM-dependent methyltransferase